MDGRIICMDTYGWAVNVSPIQFGKSKYLLNKILTAIKAFNIKFNI